MVVEDVEDSSSSISTSISNSTSSDDKCQGLMAREFDSNADSNFIGYDNGIDGPECKHGPMPIRSQWKKGKLIGRGTFASVYVGSNRETRALCAMNEVEILPGDVKSKERMRQLQQKDIKDANLLVDAHGFVKLADFGMAKHLNGEAAYLSLKGSTYWLAPELLQPVTPPKDASTDLDLAIDIWSLGCNIIEMINGKPPWSDYEGAAALFKILKETPPIPEMLSAEGKDFLQCCFHRNPADRPTAVKLLDHPFMDCTHISSLLHHPVT
ncbi:hypothetical protein OROHE_012923 [Orobanche hederae]